MSDSPTLFTGFGTVTRELLFRLSNRDEFDVACIGWGYEGWPYSRSEIPYDVYPSQYETYGRDGFERAIAHFQPDVVIAFGDLWMVQWLCQLPRPRPFELWLHFPLDGGPFPSAFVDKLPLIDRAIAMTEYGRQLIEEAAPGTAVDRIYHGVDTNVFQPLTDKEAHKALHGLGGKFVVGCVARNQPRKHYPILIEAFSQFCRDKDDAVLYLHTNPDDIGWDLHDLLRRYGISERTAISQVATVQNGVDRCVLNEIYNLFDVMALPTAGEGFGLPLVEAMAAGVPVVATNYSACTELLRGHGELVDVKQFQIVGRLNVEHAIPDVDDLAGRLDKLYQAPGILKRYRDDGLQFVQKFSWDVVLDAWLQLLHKDRQSLAGEPSTLLPRSSDHKLEASSEWS